MQIKRQTAYKLWINNILSSTQKLTNEGMRYFQVGDKEVVRVNLIAIVINRYDNETGNYSVVTIDDGSGQIRIKAWEDDVKFLNHIDTGSVVLVIARLFESNGEIFLRPEIVRPMEDEWAFVRKLELERQFGKVSSDERVLAVTEEKISEKIEPSIVAREKVYHFVEKAPDNGIEVSELVKKTKLKESDVEKAIEELLREGELYNPRPGFVKLV
ncbi:MAG: hypothetical protein KKA65_02080 [Nanoarchaeota archaeon]|nr:hypothetical protein [Nanoarchaeota archaeon]MBU4352354.1 hypothetical protein [Nanoarchaeota archaeon]MBU4456265.1 hypothetical protein [Nanoarchaeota archaeon]MCG2720380.1 OB-fold nucleic acid binding domain-containing protein [Nanoarchaeota archaeon]